MTEHLKVIIKPRGFWPSTADMCTLPARVAHGVFQESYRVSHDDSLVKPM